MGKAESDQEAVSASPPSGGPDPHGHHGNQRALAWLALLLGLTSLVVAVVAAVRHFPRGAFVLAAVILAVSAAWQAIVRRGLARTLLGLVAICLLALACWLLISRDLLLTVIVVVAAIGAVACARAALAGRIHLEPVRPPQHPVLIYNPRSGGGKATRFNLVEEAEKRGITPVELTPQVSIESMVEVLLADGADGLAVAGGDGSQAQVAAIAARENVPYACIPAGTRNHFALDLGVDREDVVGALDAFVNGGERLVDLAEVNGQVFVNNVSLGVYGDAVSQTGYRESKLRTILDVLPDAAGPRAVSSRLTWRGTDGPPHDGGIGLLVSNDVYRLGSLIGSGTRPRLDAGRLGVVVMETGRWLRRGAVSQSSESVITVDSPEPVPAGIDGEAVVLVPPIVFRSRPRALRVRIAPQHPGCSPSAVTPGGLRSSARMLCSLAVRGKR